MPGQNYCKAYRLADGTRVDIFALDTNGCHGHAVVRHPGLSDDLRKSIATLAEKLKATPRGGWRIVFGHHPLYTKGRRHGVQAHSLRSDPSRPVRGASSSFGLERVLAEGGVHVYVSGHEHVMQYHCSPGGVRSIVSGAVASSRWHGNADPAVHLDWVDHQQVPGFAEIAVTSSALIVSFVRAGDGKVIHRDVIPKDRARRPSATAPGAAPASVPARRGPVAAPAAAARRVSRSYAAAAAATPTAAAPALAPPGSTAAAGRCEAPGPGRLSRPAAGTSKRLQ
eukprot:TRINITY_DN15683_c0_g1_i3.p1 TRINITY_DN15683_c0_g1~~TRINITY_DN15683_c0_g1_i3.p1  ORF type:complete len:282 (+),score=26.66 TRINITY_DN15683_c0_g1_i3:414-1259(+)